MLKKNDPTEVDPRTKELRSSSPNRRDTNRDARRREQDRNEHDRIVKQRTIISEGWPYPGQRDRINRIIIGALRDCVVSHGAQVEGSWIGSAQKRIVSNLYSEGFREKARSLSLEGCPEDDA